MALPVVSSNSPSSGYISWTGFNIQYGGQEYEILAGNTNKKFAWWSYGSGEGNLVTDRYMTGSGPFLGASSAELPPAGGAARACAARDHWNAAQAFAVTSGQQYRVTVTAKRTAGTRTLRGGIWYTAQTSGSGHDGLDNFTLAQDLGGGWGRYTRLFTVPAGKTMGAPYIQIDQSAGSYDTTWHVSDLYAERVAGSPSIQTSDTLPEGLAPEDYLLFLNKGGIGTLIDTTEVLDGALIVNGSIYAPAIAADQIKAWHVDANAITAEAIAAGAVGADEIAAGAVTASKLSVGSVGEDLVRNGSFEDGVDCWYISGGSGNGAVADVVTGVSSSGSRALRLARGTANNLHVGQTQDSYIPVTAVAGRSWYVACRAGASAPVGGFYLRVCWWQANKTTPASTAYVEVKANQSVSTAWAVFEGAVTPPANAQWMQIVLINSTPGSTMYVDEVSCNEVIVSAQIGSGQIQTPHLAAGSVKADAIDANAVTASKIAANTITSGSAIIQDGAITTAKIGDGQITNAKITNATIESAKIKDGAITTAKIADAQITNAKIANLDAAKINTGTLSADRIGAGFITADKIAVGAVTADKLNANAVQAQHISSGAVTAAKIAADAIDGMTITGTTMQTHETGPRVVNDIQGVRVFGTGPVPRTHLTTDPLQRDRLGGDVDAVDVAVSDTLTMLPGSSLVLAAGTLRPPTGPAMSNIYESITLRDSAGVALTNVRTVGRMSDGKWVAARWPSGYTAFLSVHATDGTWIREGTVPSSAVFGSVVNDRWVVVLNWTTGSTMDLGFVGYDLTTFANGTLFEPADFTRSSWGGTYYLAIGWDDGARLLISNGLGVIRTYTLTWSGIDITAASVATKTLTTGSNEHQLALRSSFDLGADSVYTVGNGIARGYTWSSGAANANADFPVPFSSLAGAGYYSGAIWVVPYSSAIVRIFDGPTWSGAATRTVRGQITYYDSVGTTHESAGSPITDFTHKKRARILIDGPNGWASDTATGDSVNQLRFYASAGAGSTPLLQSGNSSGTVMMQAIATGGAAAPSVTNFPGSAPSDIRTQGDEVVINADGTGRIPASLLTDVATVGGSLAADNYYEKYADGRLIVRCNRTFPSSAGNTQSWTWTYPVPFVGELPHIDLSVDTTAPQNCSMAFASDTLTGCVIYFHRTTAASTGTMAEARGRWK